MIYIYIYLFIRYFLLYLGENTSFKFIVYVFSFFFDRFSGSKLKNEVCEPVCNSVQVCHSRK